MIDAICTVEGCEKWPQHARGWCDMHYQRWRIYGDLTHGRATFPGNHLVRVESGCLEWTGAKDKDGYGYASLNRKKIRAHRAAWSLAHPDEPLPPMVCHTCDNPPCCEPTHLVAGTVVDNARDRVERGRSRPLRGDAHPLAKLTDSQVAALRSEYAAGGVSQAALGRRYGIGQQQVHRIIHYLSRAGSLGDARSRQ